MRGAGRLFGLLAVLLTVGVSFCATGLGWYYVAGLSEKRVMDRFVFQARELQLRIEERIEDYEQILLGGAGLFAAMPTVTRETWQAYVARLKVEEHFPGIQGIGFTKVVAAADRERHIAEIRAEGFADYTIQPEGDRPEYTAIVFLEPFSGRNLRAFGYDMFSEPVRRAAMEQARDTGETRMSRKVRLVQETTEDVQTGFLMYVPVYAKEGSTDTVAGRRAALIGYVYSPFRMNNLIHGILSPGERQIHLDIFDGPEAGETNGMYSDTPPGSTDASGRSSGYHTTVRMAVNGATWTLVFTASPAFEATVDRTMSWLVLGGGGLSSLLLGIIAWSLARTRGRALIMANAMTEALRESEIRYRAVFENAGLGIFQADAGGCLLTVNPSLCRMLGYGMAELEGRRWLDLIYPDDPAANRDALDRLIQDGGQPVEIEGRWRSKAGAEVWIHLSVTAVRQGWTDQPLLIGMAQNITERKQAEDERRKLLWAVEQSPTSIVITDVKGTIEYVNHKFVQITGYEQKEAIGQNPSIIKSGTTPPEIYEGLWQTITAGQEWQGELQNRKRDGTLYWERASISPVRTADGTITHFLAIKEDITERRKIECALRDSETRFARLSELTDEGICLHGQGQIIDVNTSFCRMLGYERDELVNRPYPFLVHPASVDRIAAAIAGQAEAVYEAEMVRKDGTVFPVEIHSRDVQYDGEPIRVAAFRDITEGKKAQRILTAKTAELEQSNTELAQFAYVASHDLREPLRMINSYLTLLERRYADKLDAGAKEFIGFARDGATRMNQLVLDLLDFSRVGRSNHPPVPTSVGAAIEDALRNLQILIDGAEARVTVADGMPMVEANAIELSRLFQNLVGNAIKYRSPARRPEIRIDVRRQDPDWVFSVQDNGIGIEAPYFEKVFMVFQRLHSRDQYEGTGIGLAVCRKIVEQHGGRIWVASEPDQGSTFQFTLPIR